MKKILPLLVLIIIIPQIAFAAWWNPLSWFGGWSFFHRNNNETEILNENIGKSALNEATSTSATTTPTVESIKNKPSIDNSILYQNQLEAVLKAKAEQDALIYAQQKAEQDRLELIKKNEELDALNFQNDLAARRAANLAEECKTLKYEIYTLSNQILTIEKQYYDLIYEARQNTEGTWGGAVESKVASLQREEEQATRDLEYKRDLLNNEYSLKCN